MITMRWWAALCLCTAAAREGSLDKFQRRQQQHFRKHTPAPTRAPTPVGPTQVPTTRMPTDEGPTPPPTTLAPAAGTGTGEYYLPCTPAGALIYVACSVGSHCLNGQRVTIQGSHCIVCIQHSYNATDRYALCVCVSVCVCAAGDDQRLDLGPLGRPRQWRRARTRSRRSRWRRRR